MEGVTVLIIALVIIAVILMILYKMVGNRNSRSFFEKVSHILFET